MALWGNSRELMAVAGTPDGVRTAKERHREGEREEEGEICPRNLEEKPAMLSGPSRIGRMLGRAGEALLRCQAWRARGV